MTVLLTHVVQKLRVLIKWVAIYAFALKGLKMMGLTHVPVSVAIKLQCMCDIIM